MFAPVAASFAAGVVDAGAVTGVVAGVVTAGVGVGVGLGSGGESDPVVIVAGADDHSATAKSELNSAPSPSLDPSVMVIVLAELKFKTAQ